MSDEELQTIWRQSIDHYSKQLQSIVCMEECGELIQAGHLYCPSHAKDIWEES